MRKLLELWRTFAHGKLGWGYPASRISGFDGASFTNICGRCNGNLLQDSQGNWFHVRPTGGSRDGE